MDHHFRCGANGTIDELEDRNVYGAASRPASTSRASATSAATSAPTCAASATRAAPAGRAGSAPSPSSASARAFKDAMAHARPWRDRRDRVRRDAAEPRQPRHARRGEEGQVGPAGAGHRLRDRRERAADAARHDERHGRDARGGRREATCGSTTTSYFPGMGIHEMGTARMGRDPKTSVLNGHNQVWDAPNVFVTDGACMTSAACVRTRRSPTWRSPRARRPSPWTS